MSVIPKPSPACDAVLAAVAGGSVTVPALVAATGRTRCAVNHAVARLRSRGLVSGTSRDGSLALTGAGRAALGGDTASAAKAGRRPTTSHLVLHLVVLGVATVAAMARATGMGEGTLRAAVRSLVVAGRLTRTGFAYRLTGVGAEVLAEYTRTWGPPAGLPDAETVRRAADQVRALYGRGVLIFPPQVIDAADTFFSRETPPGRDAPGRRYVGLSTTGVKLTNAEIQTAQTLMAGSQLLLDRAGQAADPYMTLVGYFSATRELAGMARYIQDDVQTALAKGLPGSALPKRTGNDYGSIKLGELTSRIASADITSTLEAMTRPFDPAAHTTAGRAEQRRARQEGRRVDYPAQPYDVVLATSMLQVGVDVSRLGLMLIVGQPKNTAEYIQASSRVGRDASRPGLVVILGNWARPRDLAHYEQFRHFHETFYAQVEPLSVTPFSATSLERGLDGVLVAAARILQATVPGGLGPERNAGAVRAQRGALDHLVGALVSRTQQACRDEATTRRTRDRLTERVDQWERSAAAATTRHLRLVYEKDQDKSRYTALIRSAESAGRHQRHEAPFVVANSMREVQPEINILVSPDERRLAWVPPEGAPPWTAQEPQDEAQDGEAHEEERQ